MVRLSILTDNINDKRSMTTMWKLTDCNTVPGSAGQLLRFVRVKVDEVNETVRFVDVCQIHVLLGRQTLGVVGVVGTYLFRGRLPVQAQSRSLFATWSLVFLVRLLVLLVRQPISTFHHHVLGQSDSAFHRVDHQTATSVVPATSSSSSSSSWILATMMMMMMTYRNKNYLTLYPKLCCWKCRYISKPTTFARKCQ